MVANGATSSRSGSLTLFDFVFFPMDGTLGEFSWGELHFSRGELASVALLTLGMG